MGKGRDSLRPNDYLFVTSRIDYGSYIVEARHIFEALASARRWFLPPYASFRAAMTGGDRIIIYIGGPRARQFVADAVLASGVRSLNAKDKSILSNLRLIDFELVVDFSSINVWTHPVPISPVVPRLGFIKDKRYPGQFLRHGVVRLAAGDFEEILRERTQV
jgi:hypothetical protein